jgi:hypothetical protein
MQVFFLVEFGRYLFLLLQVIEQYFLFESNGETVNLFLHSWQLKSIRVRVRLVLGGLGFALVVFEYAAEQE